MSKCPQTCWRFQDVLTNANIYVQCVPSYEASISPGNSDIVHHMEVIISISMAIIATSITMMSFVNYVSPPSRPPPLPSPPSRRPRSQVFHCPGDEVPLWSGNCADPSAPPQLLACKKVEILQFDKDNRGTVATSVTRERESYTSPNLLLGENKSFINQSS